MSNLEIHTMILGAVREISSDVEAFLRLKRLLVDRLRERKATLSVMQKVRHAFEKGNGKEVNRLID